MASGQIIPAAFRLHPERLRELCAETLEVGGPGAAGIMELVDEAAAYFEEVQRQFPGPKTYETALKCVDILSGDAGRIFLSPGNWSEAGRALGWPLSGFAFDAEQLIRLGARVRPYDLISHYAVLIRHAMQEEPFGAAAKDRVLAGIRRIHKQGELSDEAALNAIQVFRINPGEELWRPHERRKYEWPSGMEIVWDGPLSLEYVVEIRRDDELIGP
jgi:hypothetical protein